MSSSCQDCRIRSEDGGSRFVRNVIVPVPDGMALHPVRQHLRSSPSGIAVN
jgi:hypothetical protein